MLLSEFVFVEWVFSFLVSVSSLVFGLWLNRGSPPKMGAGILVACVTSDPAGRESLPELEGSTW